MSATTQTAPTGSAAPSGAFFPGLNELRALAILIIIPGHIEYMKEAVHLPHNYWFPIPGKVGVVFFFTLSGFLITTLLLKEQSQSPNFNIKNFYYRRMLRLLPLYFLVMGMAILVLNKIRLFQLPALSSLMYANLNAASVLLLLLGLPNYVDFIIPYAAQAWAVGIEIQFYWVHPLLVKLAKKPLPLIAFMLPVIFLKEIAAVAHPQPQTSIGQLFAQQTVYFGCIAIGCVGAILYREYPKHVRMFAHHKLTQITALVAFLVFLIAIYPSQDEQAIDFRYYAVLFTVMIFNAGTNPSSFYNLNNRVLNYLGKISYGIYMYHAICIGMAIAAARLFAANFGNHAVLGKLMSPLTLDIFLYSSALLLTILVSAISFKYFESYFLRLKNKAAAPSAA